MPGRGRPALHSEGEMCVTCGERPKMFHGYSTAGTAQYKKNCGPCHHGKYYTWWQRQRKAICELCDYRPLFLGSLDIHHRDGDRENNDPMNLMTLCATCHREMEGAIHDLDGNWEKAEKWIKKLFK